MTSSQASSTWHAIPAEKAIDILRAEPIGGLDQAEVDKRLAVNGPNRVAGRPPRPVWLKFIDQFRNLLVIVLIAAAVLAGAVGDIKDTVVIAIVVLLNAFLGFFQEHRAEAALSALRSMLAPVARVRRDGRTIVIPAEELVPGDIVLVEAGDRIPADARVLVSHSAEVAEAALTGESHAVWKGSDSSPEMAPLAERHSMVFMNTVVARGRIEAVVCATGMQTEMGKLAGLLAATAEPPTPLQQQLNRLGKKLAAIAGLVVGIMFAISTIRGDSLTETAMTAIALAVAAIPEGLPAVVTVTLALGMRRMAKQKAIVKKLAAVETLGCTTVICSDKTGTLTLNQMTARRFFSLGRHFTARGEGYRAEGAISADDGGDLPEWRLLLAPAALCADSTIRDGELIGDPTEGAVLALAAKVGLEQEAMNAATPRIAEIPFDSAHKFMATFHHDGPVVRMWLKGAPDVLFSRCASVLSEQGEIPFDDEARAAFLEANAEFGDQALRVLAFAGRSIPAAEFDPAADLMPWATELTLIGVVGMIDPPRPEAREAIGLCSEAGIGVKMITGDQRATARAIANDLGIEGEVREGREIESMSDHELAREIENTAVFARVAPEHKLRIVQALKERGHVVAMTGDGVNDAPALKAADIGVAMGITGTEVTKEAATLILTDDNFATIVKAVKEGRTIYDNIIKFVRFQLSTNVGAIFTVLGAQVLGLPSPFTAIQILWVNIIMDGPPAMTLGVEPSRPGIMQSPPRATDAHILTFDRLWRLCLYGLTMAAGTLGVYAWAEHQNGHAYAVTLAFTTFVLFQFFNIFNARAEHGSAFNKQFFSNGKLWSALTAVVLLQVVAVHWAPAQAIFDTVDLQPREWVIATVIASTTLLFEEARKLMVRAALHAFGRKA